jgi:2-polyprenyl-6-methoxyphenol hydroxylase-like FAD-dependent oxidoreductase
VTDGIDGRDEGDRTVTSDRRTRTAVLVVGAGPTGLLLAAELQRRGVECLLVDAHAEPNHWDRATVVHPRSLELFESLGLVDQFLRAGTPQRGARLHSGGEVLGSFDTAMAGSRYEFDVGVSEEVTERILTGHLEAHGGAVTRGTKLVGLTPHADVVRAVLERDGEPSELEARWVVGCDGLHSPTRVAIGVEYEGHDITEPWAVFDATLAGWSERYDVTMVYLDAVPVILTPLPDQRWRVYLRPSSPDSDLVVDALGTLGAYSPQVSFVDVENPVRFQCHSEVAQRFRSGRVLLAGDAAHLCSPAQGHGMNTGLQDAANLAWKLALVLDGAAAEALLDSYQAERRPAAALVANAGDDFEHAQLLVDPAARAERDAGLRATFGAEASAHHEAVAHAELNIAYSDSPIVAGDADTHLGPGDRIPDTVAVEAAGGGPALLHAHAHRTGHTVVLLAGPTATARHLAALVDGARVRVAGSPRLDAVVAFATGDERRDDVGRIDADATERLGVNGVTLLALRPDGYVGLRADHDHLAALDRYDDRVRTGHG